MDLVLAPVRVEHVAARARAAQRVAHQREPLGAARGERELDRLGPDMRQIADDFRHERALDQREAGEANLAVVDAVHGV